MQSKMKVVVAVVAAAFAGSALAVSAEEAAQLKGPNLTPWGAEKGGNKDGTIPAWTGEGVKPPASYNPKDPGQRPSPYKNEKPLFTITAQNAAQYADKLDGQIEMFKRYPNYRMDIYPTHRNATFPKVVMDNTYKNATVCKTTQDGIVITGCYGGFPFPIPKTGAEAMWNHLAAYQGEAWAGISTAWVVPVTGVPVFMSAQYAFQSAPFFSVKNANKVAEGKDIYWRIRVDYVTPPRRNGEKLVVIDPLDQFNYTRRAYTYIPGQRRVKLAPDLAYDTPSPTGGGVSLMDDGKGFLGALDRYDWKLQGKKEKFIMYNTFDLSDAKTGCSDVKTLTNKNFPNPDCIRWELHRVWAVEGKLKPGYRHSYHRRMHFWDEDTYQCGTSETYDAAGTFYRMSNQICVPLYDAIGVSGDGNIQMDVHTGLYAMQGGVGNADGGYGWKVQPDKPDEFFSPETLAAEGIR